MPSNFQIFMGVVAALRAFGVFNAWITPVRMKTNVYSRNPNEVTSLQSRLFGWWTALSGAICVAVAYDPTNKTLLTVSIWAFVVALSHFLTEYFVFKTCNFKDMAIPGVVASSSIFFTYQQLMGLQ